MKLVISVACSIGLLFLIPFTYQAALLGTNPLLIKGLYLLLCLLFAGGLYAIYSEKKLLQKVLQLLFLFLCIIFSTREVLARPKESSNAIFLTTKRADSTPKFTPTCHFYLKQTEEAWPDIDYFPGYDNNNPIDSTSFEIVKWKTKDIALLLQEWKSFQKQHSCATPDLVANHPYLHSFLKSNSYTTEIHYIYYKKGYFLNHYSIYWDKGFAILHYGWEPLH